MNQEHLADSGPDSNQIALPYRGIKNALFQYLDTLEKSNRFDSIIIYTDDVPTLFEDLKSLMLWVPASGGVIENKDGQILLIFRKGFWDLPKGKLDTLENSKSAALRECSEETGLKNLNLVKKVYETYHIYREKKDQRALKKTKWFAITYSGNGTPTPQLEEGITNIEWANPKEALLKEPMYKNIQTVIESYVLYKMDEHGYKF